MSARSSSPTADCEEREHTMSDVSDRTFATFIGTILTWTVFGVLGLALYGCPQWSIYQQRLAGEAELAKAEYSRRTQVVEAQAKKDAASLLADAEIARAEG